MAGESPARTSLTSTVHLHQVARMVLAGALLLLFATSEVHAAARIRDLDDVNVGDLREVRDNRVYPDADAQDRSELLLVHVLFRHGNRTPDLPSYPNDPYLNETYYPIGLGRLTAAGKRTQYQLGAFLRHRYGDFLGERYYPELLSARSTDYPRTKDSLALVLAALWPPAPQDRWDDQLGSVWTPIAVDSTPRDEDKLLYMWDVECPAYNRAYEAALKSAQFQQQFRGANGQIINFLEKHSGTKIRSPEDVYNIYQALVAQKDLNMKLPIWANEVFPQKMAPLTALFFELDSYTRKMQRLRAGPLLRRMLMQSVARSRGVLRPPGRKMYLYAAHDNNVSAFLRALNVWETSIPPYGVTVLAEVRRIRGVVGIELFLKNSTVSNDVYPLRMPDCEHFCPLHKFLELTLDVLPLNWDAECNAVE